MNDAIPFLLVIRADASAEIGTGHVMRMLALAQAWEDGGPRSEIGGRKSKVGQDGTEDREGSEESQVLFVCAMIPEALERRLKDEGFQVERITATPGSPDDLKQTLETISHFTSQVSGFLPHPSSSTSWLALDGYPFDLTYQRAIRAAGFKLLVVDDYNHLPEYECDVLLNQNIGAEEYAYHINADARKILGPRYALLRREFRETMARFRNGRMDCREIPEVARRILVTMGGADLHNVALKVIKVLNRSEIKDLDVKVVVGAASRHLASLNEAIQSPETQISCQLITQATNMPPLMEWADVAVTAAGSTCWELMAMGLPMVVVIVADNQERIAKALRERDMTASLGWFDCWSEGQAAEVIDKLLPDVEKRQSYSDSGRQLIDGRGVQRVVLAMIPPDPASCCIRKAGISDMLQFFDWVNEPMVRLNSFHSELIGFQDHEAWFLNRISSPTTFLFVLTLGDLPVGQIRFDISDDRAWIDYSLDACVRGSGMGEVLLRKGMVALSHEWNGVVMGRVKPSNKPSATTFSQMGFERTVDLEGNYLFSKKIGQA